MNDNYLPEGTIEYREYEVSLDGESGSLALTLGQPQADTMSGKFARLVGANAYGLVSILGLPSSPARTAIWILSGTHLGITTTDGEPRLPDELRSLMARYLVTFFTEIGPELARVRFESEGRGDQPLN